MLQRSPKTSRPQRRNAHPRPLSRIAPVTLSLPSIDGGIRTKFVTSGWSAKSSQSLSQVAHGLVDSGFLRKEHFGGPLNTAVSKAIASIAKAERPKPLALAEVHVMDHIGDEYYSFHNDQRHEQAKEMEAAFEAERLAALVVHTSDPFHCVIGHRLQTLEDLHEGLGYSVLRHLHDCLMKSCRGCDPIMGIEWASYNYWGGEMDESMRIEEEFGDLEHYHDEEQKKLPPSQRKPFDKEEALKKIDIFKRADYNKHIPTWAGADHYSRILERRLLRPDELLRLDLQAIERASEKAAGRNKPKTLMEILAPKVRKTLPLNQRIINAAVRCASLAKTVNNDDECDNRCFENISWEVTPFLLRWHWSKTVQDPLAMIYDENMNNLYQAGEWDCSTNAVFLFWDHPSLVSAVKRFQKYCRCLGAAEHLISLLCTKTL